MQDNPHGQSAGVCWIIYQKFNKLSGKWKKLSKYIDNIQKLNWVKWVK